MSLAGKRVTVWGLGLFGGGVAVTRYLVEQGAQVTVIDTKSREKLRSSLDRLADLDVATHVGEPHRDEDLLGADLVIKSPAIPPSAPWLSRLERAGVRVSSEIALGLAQIRVPYAIVTGSKGKTTTASLFGAMLAGGGVRNVEVAGNNERPLLDALRRDPEVLVLELSSFMADAIRQEAAQGVAFPRPRALVFTRLCPEHLNWHGTLEHYYGAKLSLLDLEPEVVVAPAESELLRERLAGWEGPIRWVDPGSEETTLREGWALSSEAEQARRCFPVSALNLLGGHNLENALAACAGASALGAQPSDMEAGVRGFQALEHRLQTVATRGGLRFVDDSTATTPEATIAALRAVPKPVVLLAGGSEKGADYTGLGAVIAREARTVVTLGVVGERIASASEAGRAGAAHEVEVVRTSGTFDEAFAEALARCGSTGTLLMSPAAASYDMFTNFKARGRHFAALAQQAAEPCDEAGSRAA